MNILFICNEYPPAKLVGGIGIFVKNIAQQLAKSGFNIVVIGLYRQTASTDEMVDGVRVVRLSAKKQLGLGWWIQRRMLANRIKGLHGEIGFHIIETSDFDAGFWLIPSLGVPLVVRLNGGETYFRTLLREPLQWKHKYRESSSIKKANAIASVSQYTWLETKRIFGLKDDKVEILPNPVDTTYFKPLESGNMVPGCIVYSGTFIRKKGVLNLFKSLPRIFDEVKNAHLICVGADSRDPNTGSASTQQLALSLIDERYHNRITFTGRLPHEKVLPFIQRANVCVYPSYLEAFPNAWIEAMACGKAVVASNTGSGPEVIKDGETGMLCHPEDHDGLGDHIIRILNDKCLCEQLGKNARQYALENLDIARLERLNVRWYEEVIDRYRRDHAK